jgi:hypothetical protein
MNFSSRLKNWREVLLWCCILMATAPRGLGSVYFEVTKCAAAWDTDVDHSPLVVVELTARDKVRPGWQRPIRLKAEGTSMNLPGEKSEGLLANQMRDVVAFNVSPSTKTYHIHAVWSCEAVGYKVDEDFGVLAEKLARENGVKGIEDVASLVADKIHERTLTLIYHTWSAKGSFAFDVRFKRSSEVEFVKGSRRKME